MWFSFRRPTYIPGLSPASVWEAQCVVARKVFNAPDAPRAPRACTRAARDCTQTYVTHLVFEYSLYRRIEALERGGKL